MVKKKVVSFIVSAPPAFVRYDVTTGKEDVFLEGVDDAPGRLKVVLKEGQYHHSGSPAGDGDYKIRLENGAFHEGRVLFTVPRVTPDGKNAPEVLEFHLMPSSASDPE